MKQTVLVLTVALAAAGTPASALARDYFYGYRGGYHASTAAEGYQRGMADIIRSRGQANLMNAQAAGYLEDARAKYLENRYRATEIYYERRKIFQQEQAAKHAKRKQTVRRYVERRKFEPLTADEFDASTGRIEWPAALAAEDWDEYRDRLDDIFAERAKYGLLSSDEYLEALALTKEWRRAVLARRREYPVSVLHDAVRFIHKLDKELDQTKS